MINWRPSGGGSSGGGLTPEQIAELDEVENLTAIPTQESDLNGKPFGEYEGVLYSFMGGEIVKTNTMTSAEIKTKYESNANTNAFTDTEKALLALQSGENTGDQDLSGYQATLVSGTNVKSINGESILGSGDMTIESGGESFQNEFVYKIDASYTSADMDADPEKKQTIDQALSNLQYGSKVTIKLMTGESTPDTAIAYPVTARYTLSKIDLSILDNGAYVKVLFKRIDAGSIDKIAGFDCYYGSTLSGDDKVVYESEDAAQDDYDIYSSMFTIYSGTFSIATKTLMMRLGNNAGYFVHTKNCPMFSLGVTALNNYFQTIVDVDRVQDEIINITSGTVANIAMGTSLNKIWEDDNAGNITDASATKKWLKGVVLDSNGVPLNVIGLQRDIGLY